MERSLTEETVSNRRSVKQLTNSYENRLIIPNNDTIAALSKKVIQNIANSVTVIKNPLKANSDLRTE